MATPSILIVPDRYKSGVLYSQLPESGAVDFDVTRATTAYRTNASGVLESVASGVPRLDYPAAGGCPSLLIEPAATNLLLRSEEFDVSGTWTLVTGGTGVNPVVSANAGIAPDGTLSADNIVLNVGSGTLSSDFSIIRQNITVSGVAYTYSIWLKSNTGTNQFVSLRFNSAPSQEITITNNWQRFTFTGTPASGSRDFGLDLRGNNTSGQKTCNILAWGAQIETGSVATSYIPTTTASVTRNADVISKTGVSGFIGQTEGTIYAEVDIQRDVIGAVLVIDDGDTTDFISISKLATRQIRAQIRRSNGTITTIITSSALSVGAHKIALGYTNGDYALYIDGVSAGTSTNSTNYPATALTQVVLSNTSYGPLNNRISAAAIYPVRLSNTELAALTTL